MSHFQEKAKIFIRKLPIQCCYLSIAQLFALLNKLIQKSVTRWSYFSVARAPKLIDGKKIVLDTEPSTQKYRNDQITPDKFRYVI